MCLLQWGSHWENLNEEEPQKDKADKVADVPISEAATLLGDVQTPVVEGYVGENIPGEERGTTDEEKKDTIIPPLPKLRQINWEFKASTRCPPITAANILNF